MIPDIDWIAKSLEGLKPVRAGRFLVHGSHDRDKVKASDIAIEIDAGQAFGTGHHGTTAGCLEMIETVVRSRRVRNAHGPRHRQRRAGDRGAQAETRSGARNRHRSDRHAGGAENVRRNGIADGITLRDRDRLSLHRPLPRTAPST